MLLEGFFYWSSSKEQICHSRASMPEELVPSSACSSEQSLALWCCVEHTQVEFMLLYSWHSPLSSEMIWKTDYLAKYFFCLFCVSFFSKGTSCNWLVRAVVADTRQMLCVSSPHITCDCQPDATSGRWKSGLLMIP